MAEISLLAMSAILMLGVFAYGRAKRSNFDMLDAYFLMITLYFGVYSMIDALVNQAVNKDPAIVILTFVMIFLSMLVTWLLYRMLPLRIRKTLRFTYLLERWASVDQRVVSYLTVAFFAFHAYLFFEFGMLTYVGTEIEQLNVAVPTWIGPLRALVNGIGFAIYLCIVSSIWKKRVRVVSVWGIALLGVVVVLTLEGRQAFIALLIFAFVLWSCSRRENVYSVKHLPYVLAMLGVFVVFSNIYQTYRREVLSMPALIERGEVTNLISAAGNMEATIENYRQRVAMWNYNYMITSEQVRDPTKILGGALGWQALLSSLPKIMFESKGVFDPDEIVAQFYGFSLTQAVDYPTNDYANFLADFGVLMLVAVPAVIILILLLVSRYFYLAKKNEVLFLLVSVLCLQYLIKVENGYDIFVLARNVVLITVLWIAATFLRDLAKKAALQK